MNGPDIFSYPLVGGFVMLIVLVIFIVFFVRVIPFVFGSAKNAVIGLMKLIIIFLSLLNAVGYLLNYAAFDLLWWINFEISGLSAAYLIELLYNEVEVLLK